MLSKDSFYMQLAIDEAKKGLGFTSPNPLVGAVIVKNDKILAKGYHKQLGTDHAEINAIKKVSPDDLKDSTMYVTLEPCCHYGRTPPCTEAIIKSGIKRVVIASLDVDERVSGKGLEALNNVGIETKVGVLEEETKKLNSIYFFTKKNKRPYIVLKAAITLDGKIATHKNDSKWLSSESCRYLVHKLRLKIKAIAVGRNTVINDKPKLNCRLPDFENKPIDKLVFSNHNDTSLFNSFAPNPGRNFIIDKKITASKDSFINFCNENEIDSVLVEGGGEIYTWFLENNLCDKVYLFYKLSFMGKDGVPIFNGKGIELIEEMQDFAMDNIQKIDNNILIELSRGESLCLLD
ncbi:MAG: riboflavin biosynthesis protein RibD [Spirochaetes bacterium GWD1_27_9]|nr:MAG: riboflavin biosynthesis protein RibD [Spirochaetes bacterium GWB1_27_13]OHD42987.1 MAG: riboflavin biosynthesis protein RibD [Spirochaetes bacterium GWD1_27_9]